MRVIVITGAGPHNVLCGLRENGEATNLQTQHKLLASWNKIPTHTSSKFYRMPPINIFIYDN